MKRRTFIKNTGRSAALAAVLPSMGFRFLSDNELPADYISKMLKDFSDEQEEYPSIVRDAEGDHWVFTLRRLSYPDDRELVSAFRHKGDKWKEASPVTQKPGHYEAPVASCASDGYPVVSWCSIESGKWIINVSACDENGFGKPEKFRISTGKPVNPILVTPSKDRCWIAWEHYEKGIFKICIRKYEEGLWSEPVYIDKGEESCFDPAFAEAKNGDLYIAYGLTDGFHQNIEMTILDGQFMQVKSTVAVAIGGAHKNRVNMNTHPAIAFDALDRLWISYENNKIMSRMADSGDNFKGDRICAMVSYQNGRIVEPADTDKWLFTGKNDHTPAFFKNNKGRLFIATHCGGIVKGARNWEYRLSWLDPEKGWTAPKTLLQTEQQGVMMRPALSFDRDDKLWLASCVEKVFNHENPEESEDYVRSRLTKLMLFQFPAPELSEEHSPIAFVETEVEGHNENGNLIMENSGHPKIEGEKLICGKDSYSLIYGNLHEHSENSSCWPAGIDGTIHEIYRFGMYSEGYDFVGITDHGYLMTEVYWRRNLRLADFYTDPPYFVALPSYEWTKRTDRESEVIEYGAGHYNVIFASTEDAQKIIRNKREIFSVISPLTSNVVLLWDYLHEKNIDCITIPHHPGNRVHRMDWEVYDDRYLTVVELFQKRGSYEYPGCPRVEPEASENEKTFVDYALREKKYRIGFMASGDHTGMGVGVAALWAKELSREGILEAMKERRCYATTGDKIIVDFRINGSITGTVAKTDKVPTLNMKVKAQRELEKIDVLRNSSVIKTFPVMDGSLEFEQVFSDDNYLDEKEICYYYIRATQKNNQIAWSSPIWVEAL